MGISWKLDDLHNENEAGVRQIAQKPLLADTKYGENLLQNKDSTIEKAEELPSSLTHISARTLRPEIGNQKAPRITHYLFRFPAKFHPPVAHWLIRNYTTAGRTVLDPFCGSGTLLLTAAIEGRHAIGTDVDPVAVLVAKAKTHRLRPGHLRSSWNILRQTLSPMARSKDEYIKRRFTDISFDEYESVLSGEPLWTPRIPNILHWFRKYVILDLARILNVIDSIEIPTTHRAYFRIIFASIIRNSSNADPVPVSGLEFTKHMKALDAAGRQIDPFSLFFRAVLKGLSAMEAYWEESDPSIHVSVSKVDARVLRGRIRREVDTVITSPPYHSAVDYYRRHQLELFWLGCAENQTERLKLLPHYIGRP